MKKLVIKGKREIKAHIKKKILIQNKIIKKGLAPFYKRRKEL